MVRMVTPRVNRDEGEREGRGFSVAEVREAGLNVSEARRLGVPVDTRRKSIHPDNVEALKEWVEEAGEEGFRVPKPKQSSKGQRGRAYRGLTGSGKKMRGLRKEP